MRAKTWRDDPQPYLKGAKHHSLVNEDYWQAMFRVSYFRWAAGKPFVSRDPITGREERTATARTIERKSNIIAAREWLRVAATLREIPASHGRPDVLTAVAGS